MSTSLPPSLRPDQGREHDRAYLRELLSLRNQEPSLRADIDAAIEAAFVRPVAMLVLDMSGFSRLTARHGVIHFLAMIHRMEQAARPAITANGGEVIKQDADNLIAVFSQPERALEGALDIDRALDAINTTTAPESHLHACIGIGWGSSLIIAGHDLYGHEMNLACKLGEDIAKAGEILLTDAAHATLREAQYRFKARTEQVSSLHITAWQYQATLHPRPLPGSPPNAA